MAGTCEGDSDFDFEGSTAGLEEIFHDLDVAPTGPEFHESLRKKGVHAIHLQGNLIRGHITGPCPNLKDGKCVSEICLLAKND